MVDWRFETVGIAFAFSGLYAFYISGFISSMSRRAGCISLLLLPVVFLTFIWLASKVPFEQTSRETRACYLLFAALITFLAWYRSAKINLFRRKDQYELLLVILEPPRSLIGILLLY